MSQHIMRGQRLYRTGTTDAPVLIDDDSRFFNTLYWKNPNDRGDA